MNEWRLFSGCHVWLHKEISTNLINLFNILDSHFLQGAITVTARESLKRDTQGFVCPSDRWASQLLQPQSDSRQLPPQSLYILCPPFPEKAINLVIGYPIRLLASKRKIEQSFGSGFRPTCVGTVQRYQDQLLLLLPRGRTVGCITSQPWTPKQLRLTLRNTQGTGISCCLIDYIPPGVGCNSASTALARLGTFFSPQATRLVQSLAWPSSRLPCHINLYLICETLLHNGTSKLLK